MYQLTDFLPTTKKEIDLRSWDELDVILFSGDAYVDHPAFGASVIGRLIEAQGLKVALVPQPNWRDDLRDFKKLGKPRLFFAVTAGNMDSMVNHYTANKRLRSDDAYSRWKTAFSTGLCGYGLLQFLRIYIRMCLFYWEVSKVLSVALRYDYWSDKLMPSILVSSKADLLVYGMGRSLAGYFGSFENRSIFKDLRDIPQTAYLTKVGKHTVWKTQYLVDHATCLKIKKPTLLISNILRQSQQI